MPGQGIILYDLSLVKVGLKSKLIDLRVVPHGSLGIVSLGLFCVLGSSLDDPCPLEVLPR